MVQSIYSKSFREGELIFDQGDSGDCAFIVEVGRVEIFVRDGDTETPLTILGPGEIFGEMAVIDVCNRSAGAKSIGDTKLTIVYREQLLSRIKEADAIVRLLISVLLRRMRQNIKGGVSELDQLLGSDMGENVKVFQERAMEKIRLERDIMEAVEDQNFTLNYQPIVDLSTKKLGGYEALVRWFHPVRGMVRPDHFLGLAEETSLIVPIGLWVFRQACHDLHLMQKQCDHDIFMSINISGRQMMSSTFFDDIERIIEEEKVAAKDVKLEITERVLVEGSLAVEWINRCRRMGFMVALDDFGTGYSSLSYLSEFEIDNLKIDQAFIRKMNVDHKSRVLVETLTKMAAGLGLTTIAEGIEEKSQLDELREMGINFIQGYYYGKPEPLEHALRHLNARFE